MDHFSVYYPSWTELKLSSYVFRPRLHALYLQEAAPPPSEFDGLDMPTLQKLVSELKADTVKAATERAEALLDKVRKRVLLGTITITLAHTVLRECAVERSACLSVSLSTHLLSPPDPSHLSIHGRRLWRGSSV